MMKNLLILSIFIAFCFQLEAQWSIGLGIGANKSIIRDYQTYSGKVFIDDEMLSGYSYQLIIDRKISKYLNISSGLSYTGKGMERHVNDLACGTTGMNRTRMNYFELPVDFVFAASKTKFSPYIAVGSTLAYWSSGSQVGHIVNDETIVRFDNKLKFVNTYTEAEDDISIIYNYEVNRWDVLFRGSFGLKYNTQQQIIRLWLNYNHGFLSYIPDLEKNQGMKHSTFSLNFAVLQSISFKSLSK